MKDHATMKGRNILMGFLGLALSAFLFGFTASPAMALSITSTYTEVVSASLGTPSPLTELVAGRLGGPLDSSLVGAFPKVTALGNTGVATDGSGARAHNASSFALGSSSKFFAQGRVGDFTKYLATQWAAAFSNTAPVTFSLSGDDHAFSVINRKPGLDYGGVKDIGTPVTTAAAVTGKQRLDLFFADAHVRQSGPSPATLLLFGAALVGLGAVLRRRMRRAATPSV